MVSVLLRAALMALLAAFAALGGDPAYASTPTGVVVDVATSPVLRETQVLNGASDFSQLLSRAYIPVSESAGADFQRLLSQPITNNGVRGAFMDLAETVVAPVAELGSQAAAMCFASPVICAGGAVAVYLAVNQWSYDSYTQQWKKPKPILAGSCVYNGVTKANYTKSQCDAYAESVAPSAKGTPGTAGYSYDGTEQLPNSTTPSMTNYWSHYHISYTPSLYNMGYYQPSGTPVNQMAPGTQPEMASDVTSAGTSSVGASNPGNAALATQLIANNQPLTIDDSATARLVTKAASATATSTQTNPDGSTTTTTDTYTGTPSSGPVQSTQVVFNSTTTTTGPTTTTTTTTTNTTNITNINNS
jgi:hypothetical protein